MIDLYNGELVNMLPYSMASGIEQQCISYALKAVTRNVIDLAKTTRTQAVIDELPEQILDLLASELRTPYYLDSMSIETKREIIKKTIPWHYRSGTTSAVSELVTTIFGEGEVIEWFDFNPADGEIVPGQFDIRTNAILTEDTYEQFLQIIRRVKNERSHLRRIWIDRKAEVQESVGAGTIGRPEASIPNHQVLQINGGPEEAAGAGAFGEISAEIPNHFAAQIGGNAGSFSGSASGSRPEATAVNHEQITSQAIGQLHAGVAAFARPVIN